MLFVTLLVTNLFCHRFFLIIIHLEAIQFYVIVNLCYFFQSLKLHAHRELFLEFSPTCVSVNFIIQ